MALDGKCLRLGSCCVPRMTSLPRGSGTGAASDVRILGESFRVRRVPGVSDKGESEASSSEVSVSVSLAGRLEKSTRVTSTAALRF